MTFDLRSDTVTQPSPAMREAMASASVGDDVYREDPTTRALEERAASLVGKEAALFMPSGTMANQIALASHAPRGATVLCDTRAHVLLYELGAMANLSGLMPVTLPGDASGCMNPNDVERALRPGPYYRVPVGVVSLEVTHNAAGGQLPSRDALDAIVGHARKANVPVHLDGARFFNAVSAYGISPAELAEPVDSVAFCFSKGLGAPVGSVLCGSKETIASALRLRKMFGGGMRQAGILAAGALYALEHNVSRLSQDHANARRLAEGLARIDGLSIDPDAFPTNILYVQTAPERAADWVARLGERGVLIHPYSHEKIRFVTHMDVSAQDIDAVLEVARAVALTFDGTGSGTA